MSIASQITRIQQDRDQIRAKLVELGLATNVDNLDVLATAIEGIENRGAISATVKEGETYTIPKGYHTGSGTVSGVAGGGNYSLQSKAAITPTKQQQQITADDGFYGLSDVTIGAIPDAYQDVTSVTAGAADVLLGKVIVDSKGAVQTGSMPNNGTVEKTLTTADPKLTIAAGYHDGHGLVQIVPEDKSITPTKEAQTVSASAGKVLNKVSVAAIPDNFIDTTDATATADKILIGETAYVDTVKVEGTMANNGAVSKTLDATADNQSYTVPVGFHNGAGSVQIVLEQKSVTPTKAEQVITPATGKVLSKVSVAAIPDEYQVVTEVDAVAEEVLAGKKIVDAEGNVVEGTMPNVGSVSKTLDATTGNQTLAIAKGYHDGTGSVNIVLEEKSVTPTKEAQTIAPAAGKVLSKVSVAAIPAAYQDVTKVDAEAAHVLEGKTIVDATGAVVAGTMANNGSVVTTIDGLTTMSYAIPAGFHDGTGSVTLTNDIEEALAAI